MTLYKLKQSGADKLGLLTVKRKSMYDLISSTSGMPLNIEITRDAVKRCKDDNCGMELLAINDDNEQVIASWNYIELLEFLKEQNFSYGVGDKIYEIVCDIRKAVEKYLDPQYKEFEDE